MTKSSLLLSVFLCCSIIIAAQPKPTPVNPAIENIFKEIKEFQKNESKSDSVAGHPLGSNTEEDFLRRYNFYNSVNTKLSGIDREGLSFDDRINHELLRYSIEDEISSYKFKAYFNPILADEGFHTGLAAMGSEVLDSKKEFDNYIKTIKGYSALCRGTSCSNAQRASIGYLPAAINFEWI